MAQAGPSRPSPTEPLSHMPISSTVLLEELYKKAKILREQVKLSAEHRMLKIETDLRMGKVEQMDWEMDKRFDDRCRKIEHTQEVMYEWLENHCLGTEHTQEEIEKRFDDRCQMIDETQEEIEKRSDDRCQMIEKTQKKIKKRFDDRCQMIEKTQEEMEKRFDDRCQMIETTQEEMEKRSTDRCQEIEETQRKILEAPEELSRGLSKQGSFASALSNALKQGFANLLHHGKKLAAIPAKAQARMANFFNGSIRLGPTDHIPYFTKLRNLYTILQTHWQASQHLDSAMTAAYPWLCFAMASCYYLAVSCWFLLYAYHLYEWLIEGFRWKRAISGQIFGVICCYLEVAIPYTLGLGKRFAMLVMLVMLLLFTVVILKLGW